MKQTGRQADTLEKVGTTSFHSFYWTQKQGVCLSAVCHSENEKLTLPAFTLLPIIKLKIIYIKQ